LEITPGSRYFTYYQSTIGLIKGEFVIERFDILGGTSFQHFYRGHFPEVSGEICPGGIPCGLMEREIVHLITEPIYINRVLYVAVRDLTDAMYAVVAWDGETRTLSVTSKPLPFYDGEGLPEDYRDRLFQRTFNSSGLNTISNNHPTFSEQEFVNTLNAEVLRLVNEIRAEEGLNPLDAEPSLNASVQLRAEEIKEKFSHTRPNGNPASSAYADTPYYYGGENILLCMAGTDPQNAALLVVDMWMNSSGHKANILNPSFRYMGVGAVRGENGKLYCVQGFLRE